MKNWTVFVTIFVYLFNLAPVSAGPLTREPAPVVVAEAPNFIALPAVLDISACQAHLVQQLRGDDYRAELTNRVQKAQQTLRSLGDATEQAFTLPDIILGVAQAVVFNTMSKYRLDGLEQQRAASSDLPPVLAEAVGRDVHQFFQNDLDEATIVEQLTPFISRNLADRIVASRGLLRQIPLATFQRWFRNGRLLKALIETSRAVQQRLSQDKGLRRRLEGIRNGGTEKEISLADFPTVAGPVIEVLKAHTGAPLNDSYYWLTAIFFGGTVSTVASFLLGGAEVAGFGVFLALYVPFYFRYASPDLYRYHQVLRLRPAAYAHLRDSIQGLLSSHEALHRGQIEFQQDSRYLDYVAFAEKLDQQNLGLSSIADLQEIGLQLDRFAVAINQMNTRVVSLNSGLFASLNEFIGKVQRTSQQMVDVGHRLSDGDMYRAGDFRQKLEQPKYALYRLYSWVESLIQNVDSAHSAASAHPSAADFAEKMNLLLQQLTYERDSLVRNLATIEMYERILDLIQTNSQLSLIAEELQRTVQP